MNSVGRITFAFANRPLHRSTSKRYPSISTEMAAFTRGCYCSCYVYISYMYKWLFVVNGPQLTNQAELMFVSFLFTIGK